MVIFTLRLFRERVLNGTLWSAIRPRNSSHIFSISSKLEFVVYWSESSSSEQSSVELTEVFKLSNNPGLC